MRCNSGLLLALSVSLSGSVCAQETTAPPAPVPGQTVKVEKTETSADGKTTTTVTTTTTAAETSARPARIPGKEEYGVGSAIRLSLGYYRLGSQDTYVRSAYSYYLSTEDRQGGAAKVDFLFYRPTRHEAGIGLFYGSKPNSDGSDFAIVGPYYRWRFGSEGRAFYEVNVDYGRNLGGNSQDYLFGGSAFGYEFPGRISLEYRYYYEDTYKNDGSAVMLGYRF